MRLSDVTRISSIAARVRFRADPSGSQSPPRQAHQPAGTEARRFPGRALRPSTPSRVGPQGTQALSSGVLPHRRVGLPRWAAGDRHSVLPRRSALGAARARDERSRRRARDHDVPASRGRSCVQLRIPALPHSRMAATVRPVQPPLSRSVPSRAVQPQVRAAHRRLVRAEASRRRLRRNVRRVADAALELAAPIQSMACHQEAALC